MSRESAPMIEGFRVRAVRVPMAVENGFAALGDAIGAGVDWNEEAVGRFAA